MRMLAPVNGAESGVAIQPMTRATSSGDRGSWPTPAMRPISVATVAGLTALTRMPMGRSYGHLLMRCSDFSARGVARGWSG